MENKNIPVFKTWINMFFRIGFTVLPYIFGIIANAIFSKTNIYYGRGEFLLYSVSLISSSILAYQSLSNLSELWKGVLNAFALFSLVVISGIYAMLAMNNDPNIEVMKTLSVITIVTAVIIYYFSQLSYQEQLEKDQKVLQKEKDRKEKLEFQRQHSDALKARNVAQDNLLDNLS